jgi:Fe2+ or Zn2+ uptake regulation protein
MVYRSLSRLIAAERVIRVESLKVFMVAPNVPAVALICSACRSVALLPCPTMLEPLRRHAQARRFAIDRLVVALLGLCSKCRAGQDSDENSDPDRGFDLRPPSELLDTV